MNTFTLRIEEPLGKKLDRFCQKHGYQKTGLIKSLIRDFLEKNNKSKVPSKTKKQQDIRDFVGVVQLGGDALLDTDAYFE